MCNSYPALLCKNASNMLFDGWRNHRDSRLEELAPMWAHTRADRRALCRRCRRRPCRAIFWSNISIRSNKESTRWFTSWILSSISGHSGYVAAEREGPKDSFKFDWLYHRHDQKTNVKQQWKLDISRRTPGNNTIHKAQRENHALDSFGGYRGSRVRGTWLNPQQPQAHHHLQERRYSQSSHSIFPPHVQLWCRMSILLYLIFMWWKNEGTPFCLFRFSDRQRSIVAPVWLVSPFYREFNDIDIFKGNATLRLGARWEWHRGVGVLAVRRWGWQHVMSCYDRSFQQFWFASLSTLFLWVSRFGSILQHGLSM